MRFHFIIIIIMLRYIHSYVIGDCIWTRLHIHVSMAITILYIIIIHVLRIQDEITDYHSTVSKSGLVLPLSLFPLPHV